MKMFTGNMQNLLPYVMVLTVILILMILGCDTTEPSDQITTPDPIPAELSISVSRLEFDRDVLALSFTLSNGGEEELVWMIDGIPAWLSVSKLSGSTNGEEEINVIADYVGLDYGEYSSEISISSNGGNHVINTSISYQRQVEIFPGIGVAKIKLGDTFGNIKSLYGSPQSSIFIALSGGGFSHLISYGPIGGESWLSCFFDSNSASLSDSDTARVLSVGGNYDGLTESMLGLGSRVDEIIASYGQPITIDTSGSDTIYRYNNLGMNITLGSDNDSVEGIRIYQAE